MFNLQAYQTYKVLLKPLCAWSLCSCMTKAFKQCCRRIFCPTIFQVRAVNHQLTSATKLTHIIFNVIIVILEVLGNWCSGRLVYDFSSAINLPLILCKKAKYTMLCQNYGYLRDIICYLPGIKSNNKQMK